MSEEMWDLWEAGQFVGDNKPVTRAVIQKAVLRKHGVWRSLLFDQGEPMYEMPSIKSVTIDNRHQAEAASMTLTMLNQVAADVDANLDLDHAGGTTGPSIRSLKDLGQPGYYSFRRGITVESLPRFGHGQDPVWVDMLIPNRVVRTFQGWGSDGAINPWDDTRLILTGTWLIDKVEYDAAGMITVNCRDLAKLLIEQRLYPPIIPLDKYPLGICATYTETIQETVTTTELVVPGARGVNVASKRTSGYDSSVTPWYGFNAAVFGHRASHAFDGDGSTYWLSVGNSGPNEVWSYEWIGALTGGEPVNTVRFKPRWGGYVVYVAVMENGIWQGDAVVPYAPASGPAFPNYSDQRYVKTVTMPGGEEWFTIDLPRSYNADELWLIFTNLQNSGLGTYPYRAGVYEMEVFARAASSATPVPLDYERTLLEFWQWLTQPGGLIEGDPTYYAGGAAAGHAGAYEHALRTAIENLETASDPTARSEFYRRLQAAGGLLPTDDINYYIDELASPAEIENLILEASGRFRAQVVARETARLVDQIVLGNIDDYTDIVKILGNWAGFFWPNGPRDELLNRWELPIGPEQVSMGPPVFPGNGRTWGDFAYSGAYPVDPPCIPASFWDNKSVQDGINQIKEILGFIFYVDATGGIVFRMPNIWRTGNFITGTGFIGADSIRTIDETKVLIDYGVTIDDTNLRSEIIVVSADDPTLHTAISPGFAQGELIPSAVDASGDLSLLGGQERIMLVPNYPFISQAEVDKFAYLISLWIHWSYRKGRIRVPGNPAWEPDDQVKIYERVTEESYIHYIQGVRSSMDLDSGSWYLDIDTHWLGSGPDQTWLVNTYQNMPPALYAYLVAIGEIQEGGDPERLPPGFDPNFQIPVFPDQVPRLDGDLATLFPNPPTVEYPYDDSWSDEDIANNIGSGFATAPGPGGGGSVNHRSEAWRYSSWGARGSDLTTIVFMTAWQSHWSGGGAPANTHPGQTNTVRTTVPRAAVASYRMLAALLADQGYYVYSCGAFAGVERKIAGTNTYSAHAWGLAIDINPNVNECCTTPWGTWFGRATSPDLAAAAAIATRIRTAGDGSRVFGWGGYWSTKKDYMHFEIVATRQQLLTGIQLV